MSAPGADLTPEAQELLRLLAEREGLASPPAPPLSPAQERIFALARLEPESPYYNASRAVRLRGPLDGAALGAALDAIARRHEVLRTTCTMEGGAPRQRLHARAPVPVACADVSGAPDPLAEARRLASVEALRPMTLDAAPLLRALVVRVGADDHLVLLTTHLFAADGWSMQVLWRELGALYSARHAGGAEPPPPPMQYADFARWQRANRAAAAEEAQLARWRRRLAGAPTDAGLPLDRPRAPARSSAGAKQAIAIPAATAASVKDLAGRLGATPFMVLLAALAALLARWTGRSDLVVGTIVSNRNRAGSEDLIGTFANNLALRSDLGGDPAFAAIVERVREAALEAFANQDVPFERVVEALAPRAAGRTPLFQVLFLLHRRGGADELQMPGLDASVFPLDEGIARFDLTLELTEQADGFAGSLGYATASFEAKTVARLARALGALLAAGVASPARRLSELPFDAGLVRPAGIPPLSATAARGARVAPRDETERTIAALFEELLGSGPVSIDDGFFDLGGHSLLAVRLFEEIEKRFSITLPLATLFDAPSVATLARLLRGGTAPDPAPAGPLVAIQRGGSRRPFFCVHGGGGGALRFAWLARHLGPEQPFYALQAPGFDDDQPPLERVEAMAARYLEAVRAAQPAGPYVFGGFCMGAAVALEMALRAREAGEAVALLVVIDPPPLPVWYRRRTLDRVRLRAARLAQRLAGEPAAPADAGERPVQRANRRALRRYRPQAYDGRVAIVLASDGPAGAAEEAEAAWRLLLRSDPDVRRVPGAHTEIFEGPSAERLAAEIASCLASAATSG